MSPRLQGFGFEESPYERPNQRWVCGHTRDGRPCAIGPDARGACRAQAECKPRRRGDRWLCTRSPLQGGTCKEGPLPDGACCRPIQSCEPVPSLRAQRGTTAVLATAAVIGGLVLVLGLGLGASCFSPGEVTIQHAQILESDNAESCGACHAAARAVAAGAGSAVGPAQSELCLECHRDSPGLGASARLAHSRAAVAAGLVADGGGRFPPVPHGADGSVACSTCHREHRGARADLAFVANSDCQACHSERFDSLADGHPPFSAWPYERRTRIAFDHGSHRSKHFSAREREFSCRGCHAPDPHGEAMLVKGFEACAPCHAESVRDSGQEGIALLSLPGLDTDVLADAGLGIGRWPEDATFDIDGELSSFTRLLLAGDPAAAEALEALPEDLALNEIDDLEEDELSQVADLVWAVKRAFADLARDGQTALSERIEAGLGRPLEPVERGALGAAFSRDTASSAVRAWFPGLDAELAARAAGGAPATRPTGVEPLPEVELESGWFADEASFAIRYRPLGHADPFLKHWLDAAALAQAEDPDGPLAQLSADWSDPVAVGQCRKCHSLDAHEATPIMNWRQKRRDLRERDFTRFVHRPHLIQPSLRDCSGCHHLDAESDVMSGFSDLDPTLYSSNFSPIEKSTCAGCHTADAAGDSCLNCHNYHVGGQTEAVASSGAP